MSDIWKYYNHALIPTTPPHQSADGDTLTDNPLWKDKRVLFARWTSDYDSKCETNWWYCIKDEPFDISSINAKKRYEINKGNKNFTVKTINAADYAEEMYEISSCAWGEYTISIKHSKEGFISGITSAKDITLFGAFSNEDESLCGYAYLTENDKHINYVTHKVYPSYESRAINAAIVYGILEYYKDKLANGYYICDGERNIYHETRFQDYLEKYFGFRKAYCKLNIAYKPLVKLVVALLYPFRSLIGKISKLKKVSAVLKMHGICKQKEI